MPKKQGLKYQVTKTPTSLTTTLKSGLEQAEALSKRGRWLEARAILDDLSRRYPNNDAVLADLVNVNLELHDAVAYLQAAEKLARRRPRDPEVQGALAGAYFLNMYPALARQTCQRFLDRWPDHELAPQMRKELDQITEMWPQFVQQFDGEANDELMLAHDESRLLFDSGNFSGARLALERLLKRWPTFPPALNNLSQLYSFDGRYDRAIDMAERVLANEPQNVNALANLARYLLFEGRADDAAAAAERLKALDLRGTTLWTKRAETLAYLGDDAGLLANYEQARKDGFAHSELADGMFYHLTAVAALRSGDEKQARKLWQEAMKATPGFPLAQVSLDELKKPEAERFGPWSFGLDNWLGASASEDLTAELARGGEAGMILKRYLRRHPALERLIPALLDRGDPLGLSMAVELAATSADPAQLSALLKFGTGRWGPQELRQKALRAVQEAGALPPGPVRFWQGNEWHDVELFNTEISPEPTFEVDPALEPLMIQAFEAARAGNWKLAAQANEELVKQAPDVPTFAFNLAKAYGALGRNDEAKAIMDRLMSEHPDYTFGIIERAHELIERCEFEEAGRMLTDVLRRERLHVSEATALYFTQIELLLAQERFDEAEAVLGMAEDVDPDNPNIETMRQRIELASLMDKVKGIANLPERRRPRQRKNKPSGPQPA